MSKQYPCDLCKNIFNKKVDSTMLCYFLNRPNSQKSVKELRVEL